MCIAPLQWNAKISKSINFWNCLCICICFLWAAVFICHTHIKIRHKCFWGKKKCSSMSHWFAPKPCEPRRGWKRTPRGKKIYRLMLSIWHVVTIKASLTKAIHKHISTIDTQTYICRIAPPTEWLKIVYLQTETLNRLTDRNFSSFDSVNTQQTIYFNLIIYLHNKLTAKHCEIIIQVRNCAIVQ